jgi:hypothetical protein
MRKKAVFQLLLAGLLVLMASCSSGESKADVQMEKNSSTSHDIATVERESNSKTEELADEQSEVIPTNRMIIHRAELQLNVKNLESAQLTIEKKVSEYGGYIVESNVFRESEESISGQLTVRIPEKHFQKFLTETEGQAAEVLKRNVTGEDITEQYIDLESRMKSKRTVEERLLEIMGKAEKNRGFIEDIF